MAHVNRAFNVIRGVSRGITQDYAAVKAMRDSFRAMRANKQGILSSAYRAAREWVSAGDVKRLYTTSTNPNRARRLTKPRQELINRATNAARLRRGAVLGAAGIWGLSQVSDLADRAFNPRRNFMMDPTNTRVDVPIIPFI